MDKKIMIVDSDTESVSLITDIIAEEPGIRMVARAYDGESGYSLIRSLLPDIVIAGLILPGSDGFALMEKVFGDVEIPVKPRFLITSRLKDPQVVSQALQSGASYYLIKPCSYETTQLAIRRICAMNANLVLSDPETPYRVNSQKPTQQAGYLLRSLGVPLHLRGYMFLIDSLVLVTQDRGCLNMITKMVYPEVSRKYHTSPTRVERAIRHAIEACWARGNRAKMMEVFGRAGLLPEHRPSNSEFLAVLSDRLRAQTDPAL